MIDLTFTCPKCAGHQFGSSHEGSPDGPMTRHCHTLVRSRDGQVRGCKFSFSEKDDWKYFRIPGIRGFRNAGEHEIVMLIIRSRPAYGIGQLML